MSPGSAFGEIDFGSKLCSLITTWNLNFPFTFLESSPSREISGLPKSFDMGDKICRNCRDRPWTGKLYQVPGTVPIVIANRYRGTPPRSPLVLSRSYHVGTFHTTYNFLIRYRRRESRLSNQPQDLQKSITIQQVTLYRMRPPVLVPY